MRGIRQGELCYDMLTADGPMGASAPVLLVILFALTATTLGFGEKWPCGKFAREAIDLPFYVDDYSRLSERNRVWSTDRALFAAALCTEDLYYQMSSGAEYFTLWTHSLPEILAISSVPNEPESALFIASLGRMLHSYRAPKEYLSMHAELLTELDSLRDKQVAAAVHPDIHLDWQCRLWGHRIAAGLAENWKRADGHEWDVLSNDMLFLVAACPHQAFEVFDKEPSVLSDWLRQMPILSFGGTSDYKPVIEEFRLGMLRRLSDKDAIGAYDSIRKRVRARLKSAKFRLVE